MWRNKDSIMKKIDDVRRLVEDACKYGSNTFGYEIWVHHILPAVKFAKILARKTGADEGIVELAALLHDYASVKNKDWIKEHHAHGAREAEKILTSLNYPQEKIEQVKHCIFTHRGSTKNERKTIEAQCVADADAMTHFENMPSLLYFAYIKGDMSIEDGKEWLKNKLERDWNKLSPLAKELIREKYQASKIFLS